MVHQIRSSGRPLTTSHHQIQPNDKVSSTTCPTASTGGWSALRAAERPYAKDDPVMDTTTREYPQANPSRPANSRRYRAVQGRASDDTGGMSERFRPSIRLSIIFMHQCLPVVASDPKFPRRPIGRLARRFGDCFFFRALHRFWCTGHPRPR
jgi:hypothetical protein